MSATEDTDASVAKLRETHGNVSTLLLSGRVLPKTEIKDLLKQYCVTIPRLINFCNKFALASEEHYFPNPVDSDLGSLDLSVSNLVDSALINTTNLAAEPHLRIVIEVLAAILCEDEHPANTKTPSIHTNKFPIEDPDAANCESYGRVIYWLKLLKYHYAFNGSKNKKYRHDPTTIEIQKFFMVAISSHTPENGIDLIKTVLFIFSEAVWYLETVRIRLAPLHNLVVFPGVHQ